MFDGLYGPKCGFTLLGRHFHGNVIDPLCGGSGGGGGGDDGADGLLLEIGSALEHVSIKMIKIVLLLYLMNSVHCLRVDSALEQRQLNHIICWHWHTRKMRKTKGKKPNFLHQFLLFLLQILKPYYG